MSVPEAGLWLWKQCVGVRCAAGSSSLQTGHSRHRHRCEGRGLRPSAPLWWPLFPCLKSPSASPDQTSNPTWPLAQTKSCRYLCRGAQPAYTNVGVGSGRWWKRAFEFRLLWLGFLQPGKASWELEGLRVHSPLVFRGLEAQG